jgi:hypothetical protein
MGKVLKFGAKWIIAIALALNLASCGGKATSTESIYNPRTNPQLTNQISEVSPPPIIQELRRNLEVYQPQVKILQPKADEVLPEDNVTVNLQIKDLPIYKDSKLQLGSHLDVILDNQLYAEVYDLNQPLKITNLAPGTHTLRVYASRPWDESFKNADAYAQTTFHVFTKTDENNPSSQEPLLTYNPSQNIYGAEPILLDFYLTDAPLQLTAKNAPIDSPAYKIGDWRIRCTINGESFVLDRWESVYLKGWKVGKNWVKLEFLDGQGKPVKNVFNNSARTIVYQPNGKDTLSKIVRGDLSLAQVRSIVDPSYVVKEPVAEPTPTPEVILQPMPELIPTPEATPQAETSEPGFGKLLKPKAVTQPVIVPTPELTPTPEVIPTPAKQPETPKSGFGKYLQPKAAKQPVVIPTPEVPVTPEVIPTPEVTEKPETPKSRFGKYLQPKAAKQPVVIPTPEVLETPEVIPTPEVTEKPETPKSGFGKYFQPKPAKQPVVIPTPELTPTPEVIPTPTKQPETPKSRFGKYLQPKPAKQPVVIPTPEVTVTPTPE